LVTASLVSVADAEALGDADADGDAVGEAEADVLAAGLLATTAGGEADDVAHAALDFDRDDVAGDAVAPQEDPAVTDGFAVGRGLLVERVPIGVGVAGPGLA
jgi:hypothetical protein